jgi:hypothetical protein
MKRTTTIKKGHGAASLPPVMRNSIAQLLHFARKTSPLPFYHEGPDGTALWAFLYIDVQEDKVVANVMTTTDMCAHVRNGRVLRIILPALIDSECLARWLQSVATRRLLGDILRGSALVREGHDYVGTFTNRARIAFEELRHQGMHLPVRWKAWTVSRWLERASITRLLNSKRSSEEIADIVLAMAWKRFIFLIDGDYLEPVIEELRFAFARRGEVVRTPATGVQG